MEKEKVKKEKNYNISISIGIICNIGISIITAVLSVLQS